jgi:lipopolysaccharide transport system ATP-binding protein
MSDVAIQVKGLGKRYQLAGPRKPYKTIRETLSNALLAPFHRRRDHAGQSSSNAFWALNDVSFNVDCGEVVGIIGRNGAGKSTLLKILSRITDPSAGEVEITGRVGSLLEVGTGFHPELTGRENIYLNGAILGMKHGEISRKFDEIVAFAETERFLDTPVKYYSSGMYTRLAFAVAAHLEPETLVVDEVLAVGDMQFQKKCMGKMKDVAHHGRTVLFVSHNMSAIQTLCTRCIVLQGGRILADAPTAAAVQVYLNESAPSGSFTRPAQPDGRPTMTSGTTRFLPNDNRSLRVDLEITSCRAQKLGIDLRLQDAAGFVVGFGSVGGLDYHQLLHIQPGRQMISTILDTGQLAVGSYLLSLDLAVPNVEYLDRAETCLSFDVVRAAEGGASRVLSQTWGMGSYEIPVKLSANGQSGLEQA